MAKPMPAFPPPQRRSSRRAAVIVAAVVGVIALAAGIFAIVQMSKQRGEKANAGTVTGDNQTREPFLTIPTTIRPSTATAMGTPANPSLADADLVT